MICDYRVLRSVERGFLYKLRYFVMLIPASLVKIAFIKIYLNRTTLHDAAVKFTYFLNRIILFSLYQKSDEFCFATDVSIWQLTTRERVNAAVW